MSEDLQEYLINENLCELSTSAILNCPDQQKKLTKTFLSYDDSFSLSRNIVHSSVSQQDIERLLDKARELEHRNFELNKYLQTIKQEPLKVNPTPDMLGIREKIKAIQKQNIRLRQFLVLQKLPTRTSLERPSLKPRLSHPNIGQHGQKTSGKQSVNGARQSLHSQNRFIQDIDDCYQKVLSEVSTCNNYKTRCQGTGSSATNQLAPLTETEKAIKNGIKQELKVRQSKQNILLQEISKVGGKEPKVVCPSSTSKNERNDEMAHKYQQQLILRLKKCSTKETQLKRLLAEFKRAYDNSVQRYQNLSKTLTELRSEDCQELNQEVTELYQEALQLEAIIQKLTPLYDQARKKKQVESEQEFSQMKQIKIELMKMVQRLGLKVNLTNLSLEESIEQLCSEIMNNVFLPSLKNTASINAKLVKIKQLSQIEKSNNSQILSHLKGKQQQLSKQLMNLQIGKYEQQ